MTERIPLGAKVRDCITGLEGVAYGRSQFLYGCERIAIQPPVDKDGKVPEANWVDEPQVELVDAEPVVAQTPEQRRAGGPMPAAPSRNTGPSR